MINFKQALPVVRAAARKAGPTLAKYGSTAVEYGIKYGGEFATWAKNLPWDKIIPPAISGGVGATLGSLITGKRKTPNMQKRIKSLLRH